MDFSLLKDFLDKVDKNQIPQYEMRVYLNHERIFDYYYDCVSENEKEKDLYYLFSATKVITATAAMQLIEQGKMSLEDRVEMYLPAYKELYIGEYTNGSLIMGDHPKKAETPLTIKHLLSMSGGFMYLLNPPRVKELLAETSNKATTRQIVDAFATEPLICEPGSTYHYSICHDILAAVIEVVSGMSYGEYLKQNIFEPVGMKSTTFRATPEALKRMHTQFFCNPYLKRAEAQEPRCVYAISDCYESGGAGLISSAEDYSLFADALASGETLSGKPLLKRETQRLMAQNHLNEAGLSLYQSNPRFAGYGYGLGVRVLLDKEKAHSYAPLCEYGWDGAAGAYTLIDTDNKLSIFYGQHVLNCEYVYSFVHPAIRNLVYLGLGLK